MMWNKNSLEQPTIPSAGEARYQPHLWVSKIVKPQEGLRPSDPSQSISIGFELWEIGNKIRAALKVLPLREEHVLVQFWSPCVGGKDQLLKTKDQPFGLGVVNEKLCFFRRESEKKVVLVDKDHEEENSTPPARVLRRGLPEWTSDLAYYKTEDFPLQDCAIRCNFHGYLALPVFDSATGLCVGVLELLTYSKLQDVAYEVERIHGVLKGVELTSPRAFQVFGGPALNVSNERSIKNESEKNYYILKHVCDGNMLPLAQTWTVSPFTSYVAHEKGVEKSCSSFNSRCCGKVCLSAADAYVRDNNTWEFMQASKTCHLEKSRGVAGRALSSRGSCFCEDVTKLDEEEYPLVHYARMNKLTSCFAIFLHCVESTNDYVLEFFLPLDIKGKTHVPYLVQTLKQSVEADSGFELGDLSSKEVVGSHTSVSKVDSSDLESSVVTNTSETLNANVANQWLSASVNASMERVGDNFTDTTIEKSDLWTVNVTFNGSKKRFLYPRNDGLLKLENKVAKRFKLEGQGLHLKYIDEGNDLKVIRGDNDLKLALETSGRNNNINLIYE